MTCIVGLEHKKTVWLGGDSAATDPESLDRTITKDPKVFARGEVGFGVCGLPKVMDAIAHAIELPEQSGGSDRAFLVGDLIPALRLGLKKLDCLSKHPRHGYVFSGAFLLAYRGKLYNVQSNFQLIHSSKGFDSVGSGSTLALGSLSSTSNVRNPKKRLLAALEASTANAGCAPPFVIINVKKGSKAA